MASGDTERIASGSLSEMDVTALNAMLAQADALKAGITKILSGRKEPATRTKEPGNVSSVEPVGKIVPNASSRSGSTTDGDDKGDVADSESVTKGHTADEEAEDLVAMQID
jgi:hypothetical protein